MDFSETILWYYLRESNQGFGSSIFGILAIVTAVLLFKFANPFSVLKGFTIPLIIVGLIMGIGGLTDGYTAYKSSREKTDLFKKDRTGFFLKEVPKVEKTHQSWSSVKIFWSSITVLGLGLVFFAKNNYWLGIAISTFLLSIAGHIEEAISKKFNEKYYQEINTEAQKKTLHSKIEEKHPSRLFKIKTT